MSQRHVSALFVYAADLFSESRLHSHCTSAFDFLSDILTHYRDFPGFSREMWDLLSDAALLIQFVPDQLFNAPRAAEKIRQAAHLWQHQLQSTTLLYSFSVSVPRPVPTQAEFSAPGVPSAGADGAPPVALGNLVVNSEIGL